VQERIAIAFDVSDVAAQMAEAENVEAAGFDPRLALPGRRDGRIVRKADQHKMVERADIDRPAQQFL